MLSPDRPRPRSARAPGVISPASMRSTLRLFAEACDREAHRIGGAGLGMGARAPERGARCFGLALQLMDAALHVGGGHLPDRALFRRQRIDRIEVGRRPIVAFGVEPRRRRRCSRPRRTGGRRPRSAPPGRRPRPARPAAAAGMLRAVRSRPEGSVASACRTGLCLVPLDHDDLPLGWRRGGCCRIVRRLAACPAAPSTRRVASNEKPKATGSVIVAWRSSSSCQGKSGPQASAPPTAATVARTADRDPMARHQVASEVRCSAPSR